MRILLIVALLWCCSGCRDDTIPCEVAEAHRQEVQAISSRYENQRNDLTEVMQKQQDRHRRESIQSEARAEEYRKDFMGLLMVFVTLGAAFLVLVLLLIRERRLRLVLEHILRRLLAGRSGCRDSGTGGGKSSNDRAI